MKHHIMFIGLLMLAAVSCQAELQGGQKSKIGIHLLGSYTPGAKKVVKADCPVIKILDVHGSMLQALRDYKIANPGGIVILRIYTPIQHPFSESPQTRAKLFWDEVLWPQLSRLTPAQKKLIDYVEGPNEGEVPCYGNVAEAKWVNDFYLALIPMIVEHGFKPCVMNIPVGNPSGNWPEVEAKIRELIPSLRLTKRVGGCWSYHSYTLKYTKDLNTELSYSLRYRRYYNVFKKYAPDLLDLPLILTEGGVDAEYQPGVNVKTPGWKRDSAEKFQDWLMWFDSEIKKDSYVKGITLFQIGDPGGWDSFDLEPVTDWLANYLGDSGKKYQPVE